MSRAPGGCARSRGQSLVAPANIGSRTIRIRQPQLEAPQPPAQTDEQTTETTGSDALTLALVFDAGAGGCFLMPARSVGSIIENGRSNHMAPGKKLPEKSPSSRRSFVKGLGAAGVTLPALAMLPRWGFAQDVAAPYAKAAMDWKQFAGQTITLAGAIHPWTNAITPLLPDFTELTGIRVVPDFRLETAYLGALAIQLNRRDSTPDVFMYTTYGQGISAGWLEPLNA